jgi:hypothetical protein
MYIILAIIYADTRGWLKVKIISFSTNENTDTDTAGIGKREWHRHPIQ